MPGNVRMVLGTGLRSPSGSYRNYSGAPGSVLDVPDFDAQILSSQPGWFAPLGLDCRVGPTSARPTLQNDARTAIMAGTLFIDTTLSAVIVWDGSVWRNIVTGAAV